MVLVMRMYCQYCLHAGLPSHLSRHHGDVVPPSCDETIELGGSIDRARWVLLQIKSLGDQAAHAPRTGWSRLLRGYVKL